MFFFLLLLVVVVLTCYIYVCIIFSNFYELLVIKLRSCIISERAKAMEIYKQLKEKSSEKGGLFGNLMQASPVNAGFGEKKKK